MFRFNNTHIFTGYLKQLLSSVNIPTCKIYTKEFADYALKNGTEDPRVLESFDTLGLYRENENEIVESTLLHPSSRTIYLRGNKPYYYFWKHTTYNLENSRKNISWQPIESIFFDSGYKTPGLTKTLNSPGAIYDTTTHEYLGDYLRFLRDYYNLNLMPLYNCFNNEVCKTLGITFEINNTKLTFDSTDRNFVIYAFPVKLFQNYTIAIDCDMPIELFCGLYGTELDTSDKGLDLFARTYQKINKTLFNQPFLYDKLDVKNWTLQEKDFKNENVVNILHSTKISKWNVSTREQDLKLFIKVPVFCKSSIVVLEGDYRNFNDSRYELIDGIWTLRKNCNIVNVDALAKLKNIDIAPIGKLQLLAMNTKESYPFSDRLVEYLSGSAITQNEPIPDNIIRAQRVMNNNGHYFDIEGAWDSDMQKILYGSMNGNLRRIYTDKYAKKTYKTVQESNYRLNIPVKSLQYDILGYVDRDVEKTYSCINTSDKKIETISTVDIYDGLYKNF